MGVRATRVSRTLHFIHAIPIAMSKFRHRSLVFAAVAVLGVGGYLVYQMASGKSAAVRPVAPVERVRSFTAAVNEYRAKKAQRPVVRFEPSRERLYRAMAEQAKDVKAELARGQWRWSPTVLAIEDPGHAAKNRRECDATLGKEITNRCGYRLDLVLERTDHGMGRVVFARATLLDEKPEPACPLYSECIAQGRMNEQVPLPDGALDHEAISQKVTASPPNPAMLDPVALTRTIGLMQDNLEHMKAQLDLNDPGSVHEIRRHEAILRYAAKRNEERRAELAAAQEARTQ
jgi:hypothetical protein